MPFFPAIVQHIGQSQAYRKFYQLLRINKTMEPNNATDGRIVYLKTWTISTSAMNSQKKKTSDFESLNDDVQELTRIKVRNEVDLDVSSVGQSRDSI